MPYTKQTWEDLPAVTTPLSAARLGYMEDGIELAQQGVDDLNTAVGDVEASLDAILAWLEGL